MSKVISIRGRVVESIALLTGAVLLLAGCAPAVGDGVKPETMVTSSDKPTEPSEAPKPTLEYKISDEEREKRIAELQIPAGLSTEDFAVKYAAVASEWLNAGASNSIKPLYDNILLDFYENNNGDFDTKKFTRSVAEEEAPVFATALLGEDWEKSPENEAYVEGFIDSSTSNLALYLQTQWNGTSGNTEGYRIGYEVTKFEECTPIEDTDRCVKIDINVKDNADKTIAAKKSLDGNAGILHVYFNETEDISVVKSVVATRVK